MNTINFKVTTTPLGENTITSETTVFVPKFKGNKGPNDVVCFVGSGTGLQPDIKSFYGAGGTNCQAKNGCGVHVHSGLSCKNTETQGGHWYNKDVLSVDPWAITGYEITSAAGTADFASCVYTGFDVATNPDLLEGHAFIVHNEDGSRASCGIIKKGGKHNKSTKKTRL
ncbi:unnamed protein product [Pseudo-nitzschia multistriata]|uniref:Superoxide dismutase copper/zinc binding domain-containing protein n=1 Tax=Pseudo-nitzschia multistriata TaxID=183589 RepID=A0A448ZSM5_9STRA|nr:unnamed protein product [Pseudo-nitzschia multistriata]